MSEIPYHGFLSSKPFLVIGPGKKFFYAHGELLAQRSPVLDKSINGEMREKQLEQIEIKDVDGDLDDDTVMRFIEYAYRGDYTVPNPDVLQLPTDSKELQEAFVGSSCTPIEDEWAMPRTGKKNKKKKKKGSLEDSSVHAESSALPEPLIEPETSMLEPEESEAVEPLVEDRRPERVPGPTLQTADSTRQKQWDKFRYKAYVPRAITWLPATNNDEREDYTAVFLCHARLYKFSDRYECRSLMRLVLQKLRLTLSRYLYHQERASDVVKLIQYTYAHTLDHAQGQDKLRALVLEYTTCYFRELMQELSFVELLQEGGSLPSDLMGNVAEMVS